MNSSKRPLSIPDDHVRVELKKILASPGFFRAPRMQRFLTFVVEGKLGHGGTDELKESVIGHAVFDREADYDPKSDPVVRVEARRLRSKLEEFYEGQGKESSIRIEIPKGSYVPYWIWQGEEEEAEAVPVPVPAPVKPKERRVWRMIVACALGCVALVAVWREWRKPAPEPGAPKMRSLAVLPFENLTGDAGDDYLIAGLTDEITTGLAKIRSLKVISRTSAQQYRTTNKPLPQIARELKVDAVVEGSVSGTKKHFRITAQLIRAATDSHLWAESYDRDGSDMFTVQAEIAQSIAREIGATLAPGALLAARRPAIPEAYDLYLRGRYFWNKRTLDGMEKSIAAYQRAIEIDPNYARAYAGLGDSYILLGDYGGSDPVKSVVNARAAAQEALRLDNDLAEAHTVMAAVKIEFDRDWEGATREYRKALQLDPNYPTAHHWYSIHLSRLGRHREAEAEIRRALELDPLSLIIGTDAGEAFYWAHQPDQAMPFLRRVLELDPEFGEAHMVLGKVYELKKDWPKALAELDNAQKIFGDSPNVVALRAHALALSGNRAEALKLAQQLEAVSANRYVSGVDVALIYCALGDSDHAVNRLEEAYEHYGKGVDIIGTEPLFDGCRADARFRNLLKRMQLSQ